MKKQLTLSVIFLLMIGIVNSCAQSPTNYLPKIHFSVGGDHKYYRTTRDLLVFETGEEMNIYFTQEHFDLGISYPTELQVFEEEYSFSIYSLICLIEYKGLSETYDLLLRKEGTTLLAEFKTIEREAILSAEGLVLEFFLVTKEYLGQFDQIKSNLGPVVNRAHDVLHQYQSDSHGSIRLTSFDEQAGSLTVSNLSLPGLNNEEPYTTASHTFETLMVTAKDKVNYEIILTINQGDYPARIMADHWPYHIIIDEIIFYAE